MVLTGNYRSEPLLFFFLTNNYLYGISVTEYIIENYSL